MPKEIISTNRFTEFSGIPCQWFSYYEGVELLYRGIYQTIYGIVDIRYIPEESLIIRFVYGNMRYTLARLDTYDHHIPMFKSSVVQAAGAFVKAVIGGKIKDNIRVSKEAVIELKRVDLLDI